MTRLSYTAVVERNRLWTGSFETEPYEAAWAGEAIFFIRVLEASDGLADAHAAAAAPARVQISPDGMHWCDEGTLVYLPAKAGETTFGRVRHFGGWLRLAGRVPPGEQITVIVYLVLNNGELWIEFCPACGDRETLTNGSTGEKVTVKELFNRNQGA